MAAGVVGDLDMTDTPDVGLQRARQIAGDDLRVVNVVLQFHIAAVDRSNVKLQYDIYHAQIIAGDLARTLEANIHRIGHIQIADNPGRHEPGTGELNYPFLFGLLDRLGYDGWVGCEYKPLTTTDAGLGWLSK